MISAVNTETLDLLALPLSCSRKTTELVSDLEGLSLDNVKYERNNAGIFDLASAITAFTLVVCPKIDWDK